MRANFEVGKFRTCLAGRVQDGGSERLRRWSCRRDYEGSTAVVDVASMACVVGVLWWAMGHGYRARPDPCRYRADLRKLVPIQLAANWGEVGNIEN